MATITNESNDINAIDHSIFLSGVAEAKAVANFTAIEIEGGHSEETTTEETLTEQQSSPVGASRNILDLNPTETGIQMQKDQGPSVYLPHSSYLAQVEANHRQITDRFIELLDLFNNYSKILANHELLKFDKSVFRRSQSAETLTCENSEFENERLKASTSLRNLFPDTAVPTQKSAPLRPPPPVVTALIITEGTHSKGIQTSTTNLHAYKATQATSINDKATANTDYKFAEKKPLAPSNDHANANVAVTVDSANPSEATSQRPIRRRLANFLATARHAINSAVWMIGENFTYVLFVVFCVWCLYLVFFQYYGFVSSTLYNSDFKHDYLRRDKRL